MVSNGRSITSVAKELGLRDSVLRRWVDKFRQEPTSAARRPTTQATADVGGPSCRDCPAAP
ncbi:transposase [Bradyrhizobium uaiense]|uniref:transposase n=1 Tax=Bradyrhizobium uaiense TaxID=2594946 RepID=UPI003D315172